MVLIAEYMTDMMITIKMIMVEIITLFSIEEECCSIHFQPSILKAFCISFHTFIDKTNNKANASKWLAVMLSNSNCLTDNFEAIFFLGIVTSSVISVALSCNRNLFNSSALPRVKASILTSILAEPALSNDTLATLSI